MKVSKVLSAITLALTSISFSSQAELVDSAQDWQTFETENFRVHFTPEYRQWALSSAREMEVVRKLINDQQGRVLSEKVDTYIIDPYNRANGFAFPLSHRPYMALFATPPLSDTVISNSTGWQQLLVLHEYVHLVHLAQKNRSGWRNELANWYDLYDASQINEERWVSEGYATLLESKLTGRGRLYNNYVEAIIQQFARQGALPTYAELNQANDKYMSGSMAYLVGVRYLKWLEENYSVEQLDAVWTRWHAVEQRDFEKAFKGVFQESAQHLYQRFVAEYTHLAMQQETLLAEDVTAKNEPSLWLDLTGGVSSPTISPDGQHLVIIETTTSSSKRIKKLHVYKTSENLKKPEEFAKKNEALLKADPLDIADTAPKVFKRKIAHTLNQRNSRGINNPRWLNKDTILYTAASLPKKNSLHQDIYSWHLPSNSVKQVTKTANIRRFDISNDGQYAIAETTRYGFSQLIKVSLLDRNAGEVIKELTKKSLNTIYDFPRFRPMTDNEETSFAYLVSTLNNKWQLKVRHLGDNSEQIIPTPEHYQFLSFPEWSQDGKYLYYVAGLEGATRLYQYELSTDKLSAISSGEQAVSWPTALADNKILHLATNASGPDVYQLAIKEKTSKQIKAITTSPAITRDQAEPLRLATAKIKVDESLGVEKPYGLGPQQGTITLGGYINSASSSMLEIGYKSGDVLSRFDWQVNASQDVFDNVISGVSGSVRWQGWPIKLVGHGYQFNLKTNQQDTSAITIGKIEEQGLFLEASYPYQHETLLIDIVAQVKVEQLNNDKNTSFDNNYLTFGVKQAWSHEQQNWGISQKFNTHFIYGNTETSSQIKQDDSYQGSNGLLNMAAHIEGYGVGINYIWAQRSDDAGNILSLGGYSSTLIQEKAHVNKVLSPELSFYRQVANDYQGMQAYIPFGFGEVFYSRHKMSEQVIIDSYGVKGSITNDFGFTGFTNLAIHYGVAQVNPENDKSDTQAWFGFGYKW